jgi:hypothetical protein
VIEAAQKAAALAATSGRKKNRCILHLTVISLCQLLRIRACLLLSGVMHLVGRVGQLTFDMLVFGAAKTRFELLLTALSRIETPTA